MVDYVSDPSKLRQRLNAFAYSDEAPESIKEQLQLLPGVDADVICSAAELLYSHHDQLPESGKRVEAELFRYAVEQRWAGFNRDGRSEAIVANISKELGDTKGKVPDPKDWPEPEARRNQDGDWRGPEAAPDASEFAAAPEGAPEVP